MYRKTTNKDYDLFYLYKFLHKYNLILLVLSICIFYYNDDKYLLYFSIALFIIWFFLSIFMKIISHQFISTYQGIKFLEWEFIENNHEMGTIDPILRNKEGLYARVSSLLELIIVSDIKSDVKLIINIEASSNIGDIFHENNLSNILDYRVKVYHDFYEINEEIYKISEIKRNRFGYFNKLTFKNIIPMLNYGLPK